ncbi:PKD domain-containing protein [bacterium]|nr:PKD domain-containing protein [bacterium]
MKRFPALIAALAMLLTGACAGSYSGARDSGDSGLALADQAVGSMPLPAPGASASLPALSALDALRSGSDLVETLIGGSFTLGRSAGATEQGDALLLDATATGPGLGAVSEWALYGFDPAAAGGSLDSVQVLLDAPGTGAWIGLGDFSSGRWEWHGPYSSFKSFLVDDPKYLSPGGTLFISVVSPAGISTTVNALSLRTINPNNVAPSADLQADVPGGDAPLLVSFDASASADPEGQALVYLWDWEGDGLFDASSISPLASHVYSSGGSFTPTLRVEDSSAAADSASVQLEVNSPPVAVLDIASGELRKDEPVHLSALGSGDSDGSIVNFEWDTDGAPGFEASSGTAPDYSFSAALAGPQTWRLRVTDDEGAQSLTEAPVWVRGFNHSAPNGNQSTGNSTAIAVINGQLAICYRDVDTQEMRYSTALDAGATSWSSPVVIKQPENGSGFKLREVAGRPAVAWQSTPGPNNLVFCRAEDASGSSWGAVQVLDPTSNAGQWLDLDFIGGKPALAYFDPTNDKLKFILASDPEGLNWGGPVTIENGSDLRYCSLEEIAGRPAVAFCEANNFDLLFERAEDSEGTAWSNASLLLDVANVTGISCCLVNVAGRPAIAYNDADLGLLKYFRSENEAGTLWLQPQVVDDTQDSGQSLSMVLIGGRPVIGYVQSAAGKNKLVTSRALDSIGVGWSSPQQAYGGEQVETLDMTAFQGQPAFSFYRFGGIGCSVGF